MNLVIKEKINNSAVDMVTFLEAVKQKILDQQLEELFKGIYGIEEYCLVEELVLLLLFHVVHLKDSGKVQNFWYQIGQSFSWLMETFVSLTQRKLSMLRKENHLS